MSDLRTKRCAGGRIFHRNYDATRAAHGEESQNKRFMVQPPPMFIAMSDLSGASGCPLCANSGRINRYTQAALGGRNLMTAMRVIRTKIPSTAACVIAKGGSACVGA